jgi:hypothetical protein
VLNKILIELGRQPFSNGGKMNTLQRISVLFCVIALFAFSFNLTVVRATDEVKEFFISAMIGIEVNVDANATVKPSENITVIMTIQTKTEVHIDRIDLEVFGFTNGTEQVSLGVLSDSNFDMNNTSRRYVKVVSVPESVWGVTFGEIKLAYSVNMNQIVLRFPNVVTGFPLTPVENLLMKSLKEQVTTLNKNLSDLSQKYVDLNQSFADLNVTYWDLNQNYTAAENSLGELDNTRRLSVVLAITTVCFLATTVYIILRRPRDYW